MVFLFFYAFLYWIQNRSTEQNVLYLSKKYVSHKNEAVLFLNIVAMGTCWIDGQARCHVWKGQMEQAFIHSNQSAHHVASVPIPGSSNST